MFPLHYLKLNYTVNVGLNECRGLVWPVKELENISCVLNSIIIEIREWFDSRHQQRQTQKDQWNTDGRERDNEHVYMHNTPDNFKKSVYHINLI